MSEILFRSATPEDVRFERREIDVLAVPYDTPTSVQDYDGSHYVETIAPGAFAGIATRANRIKVLRDHRPERAIGKCLRIDADRADGLHATMHITRTPLGDETLALAADGVLDVSIGFSPRGDAWSTDRSKVTRTSCWLHEVSFVPMPAYETATVLAVRQQPAAVEMAAARSATPRLDEITGWMAQMRYRDGPNQNRDEVSPPLTTA
jgi:HK97 family phage prohead protease